MMIDKKKLFQNIYLILNKNRWCRYGIYCYGNSHHNWFLAKSLHLEASKVQAQSDSAGFFMQVCVNENNKKFSCKNETCGGVYRTPTGCCNNLINLNYGQSRHLWTAVYSLIKGRTNVPLQRLLTSAYENGSLPRGGLDQSSLPNARTIRQVVFSVSSN